MQISLQTVQSFAKDQDSLNTAQKMNDPKNWALRQKKTASSSVWGQYIGVGSKPYNIAIDIQHHKYACSCPSRKLPCKHVLSLLWQFSQSPEDFNEFELPEWFEEIKKKKFKDKTASAKSSQSGSNTDSGSSEADEKKRAKALLLKQKNRMKTHEAVKAGLTEFKLWVDDQLKNGIVNFYSDLENKIAIIRARLIDAKARAFATRVDDIVTKISIYPKDEQPRILMIELGRLILLVETWIANPEHPDARRAIITTENKDEVQNSTACIQRKGVWQVVSETLTPKRHGLIGHITWLLQVASDTDDQLQQKEPVFAVVYDYFRVSAYKKNPPLKLGAGTYINATLVYYPSQLPLRAFIEEFSVREKAILLEFSNHLSDVYTAFHNATSILPWLDEVPVLLPPGRLRQDIQGEFWWQSLADSNRVIKLLQHNLKSPLVMGKTLDRAFVLFKGQVGELRSVVIDEFGVIAC